MLFYWLTSTWKDAQHHQSLGKCKSVPQYNTTSHQLEWQEYKTMENNKCWWGYFLFQCMKGKSESEVVQSCPTLRDPLDCSLPGSSVHGIFQARVLECGAIAFSRRSSIQSAKTRPGADCGSDHELLIAKFRLKLKKVGKTTRPFRYDLNQMSYDYTV